MVVGCGFVSGLDGYDVVDVAPDASSVVPDATVRADGSDLDSGSPSTGEYWREITLSSDAPQELKQHATLVVLPPTFDYAHTKPNGDDLRFFTDRDRTSALPFFIETWSPGGTSFVWVLVPSITIGLSTVQLSYGGDAQPASSFAATFPNAFKSRPDGGTTFSLDKNDVSFDWFEIQAGHTLTLPSGAPLTIRAQRIVIAGTIDGTGRGSAGGGSHQTGSGPGGGRPSSPSGPAGARSGGGGGYGGRGGTGTGSGGSPSGGAEHGTPTGDDLALGSGGGGADHAGGAGGGAISLLAWRTTLTGTVRVDGAQPPRNAGDNAGGGSGGGILIGGSFLDLAGATLSARGGNGEDCTSGGTAGGAGGGGGRVKLRVRAAGAFTAPTTISVEPGVGGVCPGDNGAAGLAGTKATNDTSTLVKGVATTLGPAEPF